MSAAKKRSRRAPKHMPSRYGAERVIFAEARIMEAHALILTARNRDQLVDAALKKLDEAAHVLGIRDRREAWMATREAVLAGRFAVQEEK